MYLLYVMTFPASSRELPYDACDCTPTYMSPYLGKEEAEKYSSAEYRALSQLALQKAATFSGQRGEGRVGWLWLLAAMDYDRENIDAVYNVAGNYHDIYKGFSALAYTELNASRLSKKDRHTVMSAADTMQARRALLEVQRATREHALPLPEMCATKAFVTFFATWKLFKSEEHSSSGLISAGMNDQIYAHVVAEYEHLRASRPELSATDLNHELFRVQMGQLESTATYWGGFRGVEGFDALVATMRTAAGVFLRRHGMNHSTSALKAAHPLVIWASVHTPESAHQPHVTDDALVGGVYYVRTPPDAGKLHIFDPRGKSPLDLADPLAFPSPPFHRGVRVSPEEGKLILFPGWLVHSVVPSSKGGGAPKLLSAPENDQKQPYRVSLSLNLKGEWYDTSSLHYREGQSC